VTDINNQEIALSGVESINVVKDNANQFIIIRFWAPWCSSCRINEDVIKNILVQQMGVHKVFKINVDREPELTRLLNVQYLPEMIVFDKQGGEHHLTGEVTEQSILDFLIEGECE
jgi:thioredoxin-like negative regulator of GroEL